jgi:superfamily II DNA or RNA helicase
MTPSTDSVAAAKSQNGKTAGPRQRPALVRLDLDGMAKIKRKISRLRKPEDMSLEAWQIALRRQFGREQKFRLKNIGKDPIFSEFEVANPQTKRTYRVAIRGQDLGDNFCSCPDFAVNTLGTCKHVEFTLVQLERKRGAKAAFAAGHRPPHSEIYVRYGAKREVVFRPGAECPQELLRYAGEFFDEGGRLDESGCQRFPAFLKRTASFDHEVRCYDDALAMIAQVRDRARLAEKVEELFPRGIHSAAFKSLLKTSMYPYQREGALFAAKAGRCLLADDMGLGKTIQAIAVVEILARTVGLERVLVVCPTSLKHQWLREIEKFSDRKTVVVEGLSARRAQAYAEDSLYKLTNYDVVHRDLALIRRWQPELVILDEAQRIKNWKTRTAGSVKQIESQYALVLTGTPLENRIEELYSIVEFVDRFRLGPMFRFLDAHQHVDEHGRVVGYRNLGQISQTLAPILIRRTKDKVLPELPERLEKRLFVPMTPEQMAHHDENKELVGRIVQKWRRYGFLSEADQRRLMIFLQKMRMSCDSTYLLDHETDFGVKADELAALLSDVLEDPDTKVVIFSQWLLMHHLVAARLNARKWQHVLFSGEVPGPKRKDLIHRFREDPDCRVFLSTDAGGVGLNLQHASVVVNLDQPWNPAVLEQRIGRVHRLGQHRPVRVVHLISQGTIEEGMLNLLGFKKAVFAGVLDGGQNEVFLGGTRLKQFMESVDKATTSIPRPMPLQQPDGDGQEAEEAAPERRGQPRAEREEEAEREAERPAADAIWTDVVTAGVSLLDKLAQALTAGPRPEGSQPSDSPLRLPSGLRLPFSLIVREQSGGQPYLKLPLPKPEILEKITGLLSALLER